MQTMRYLLSRVREEMEDSAGYADMAQKIKADNPQAAKTLMAISEQERGHASMLMQEAKNLSHGGEDKAVCDYENEVMQDADEKLRRRWEKFKKE